MDRSRKADPGVRPPRLGEVASSAGCRVVVRELLFPEEKLTEQSFFSSQRVFWWLRHRRKRCQDISRAHLCSRRCREIQSKDHGTRSDPRQHTIHRGRTRVDHAGGPLHATGSILPHPRIWPTLALILIQRRDAELLKGRKDWNRGVNRDWGPLHILEKVPGAALLPKRDDRGPSPHPPRWPSRRRWHRWSKDNHHLPPR